MKYKAILTIVGLLLAAVAAVAQGANQSSGAPLEDLEVYREPAELRKLMENPPEELILVDVRTPGEYEAGHIPGAVNIDYRLIQENPPTDDLGAPIIVYCRSGSRSNTALRTLEAMGYTNLMDWGGIMRWPFEVVTGSEPR